jgi:5-methylcytosine-specific restriction endonuclease McrA
MSARESHERAAPIVLKILRERGPAGGLTRYEYEHERYTSKRLAPPINVLRHGHGFDIDGDGTSKRDKRKVDVESPYRLRDPNQGPTLVRVNEKIESAYRESTHWKRIMLARFEKDGFRCTVCGNTEDLRCHHLVYHLFEETLDDLLTVCDACHSRIHEDSRLKFPLGIKPHYAFLLGLESYPPWVFPDYKWGEEGIA